MSILHQGLAPTIELDLVTQSSEKFSRGNKRIREVIPVPDKSGENAKFIGV